MALTTTSSLPAPLQATFNMRLLPWKQPNLIMKLAADYYRMPAAGGTTLRLRRYTKLVPPVVPIGNTGITPPSQNLTAVDIDAQMSFYATYVDINEQVTLQAQDRPLNESVKLLGQAMREAEDQLTRDVLVATAGFINCVDGVNGDNPTEITRSDVNSVVQTLLSNDAYTIMDVVEAQNKFGTAPTRPAYLVLCHSNMSSSLENVDGFINTANYPSQANVNSSEYGNVGYGRFFISSKGSVIPNASANGNDIYNNIFIGLHSYGCIEQDQYSAQFINENVNYKSSLMDLKFQSRNGVDNKAQAAKACSVNVASEKTYRNVRCGALNTPVMA